MKYSILFFIFYYKLLIFNMMKTVIVVGGGLAGLSAAIEAHEGNVRVILIEKESKIG